MVIKIKIDTTVSGKRIAHYFGTAMRWLALPVETAEAAIKAGSLYGKPVVVVKD